MATLEKIRNRIGILAAVIIGLAMLAFILGDLFTSGQSIFRQSQMVVGQINGNSIKIDEFNAMVEEMTNIYKTNMNRDAVDENTQENIREQVWQEVVQDNIMVDEFKSLGLAVSSEELYQMVTGPNPHPFIRQIFVNPKTGQYDPSLAVQFLKAFDANQLSDEQVAQWKFYENELHREKLLEKYNTLVSKSMVVSKLELQQDYKDMTRLSNVRYISMRINDVADSLVKVTGKDLKSYYEKHKANYNQEASCDMEYVTFELKPSDADFQVAQKWIDDIQEDFTKADDIKAFVNANSDVPYVDQNFKKGQLSQPQDSFAFAAKPGEVYGPFFSDNNYHLLKLAEVNFLPDSVRARHILIQPTAKTADAVKKAQQLADSLKTVLQKNGSEFGALALKYSADDGSKAKEGDLGWFEDGKMVKPFNDAAFKAKKGEIQVVETQFGYHILQVTDRSPEVKKVKLADLIRKVEPSKETYERIYEQASQFAFTNNTAEKFDKALKDKGIAPKYAMNVRPNDSRISGLESPRELVRWANDAHVGDVSGVIQLENHFVVAKLNATRQAGIAPLEQVKSEIEIAVMKEKKGEYLSQKLQEEITNNPTLDKLATATNQTVGEANDISFASNTVGSIGFEPALVGTVAAWPANKLSKPVIGNAGVYVFETTSVQEPKEADETSLSYQKNRMMSMYAMRANYETFEALKKLAKIKDNRAKFY